MYTLSLLIRISQKVYLMPGGGEKSGEATIKNEKPLPTEDQLKNPYITKVNQNEITTYNTKWDKEAK